MANYGARQLAASGGRRNQMAKGQQACTLPSGGTM
jgi:hypothetical protein